jgi:hypothetical protein
VIAFAAGWLVGARGGASPERTIAMTGTAQAAGARASLAIFAVDAAGNWPMELTVRALAPLPAGETYELWLTRGGKPEQFCGVFVVEPEGDTVVPLNAPYKLREFDGWVIVRSGTVQPLLTT